MTTDIDNFNRLSTIKASDLLNAKMVQLLKLVEQRKLQRVKRQQVQWEVERQLDIVQDRKDHYSNNY